MLAETPKMLLITLVSTNFQATPLPARCLGSLFLIDPMDRDPEVPVLILDELSPDPEAAQPLIATALTF